MATRPHLQVLTPDRQPRPRPRLCVVAGVDGSPLTGRVMRWCAGLAAVADVEVVAVYALDTRSYPPHFRHGLPLAARRSHEGWRDEIRARIDAEWCVPLHAERLHRRVIVGDGHPWEVLGRAARRHEADMVVVGCRPRGALVEALRPAVSRRLLREAVCPVVVVPEAATEPAGDLEPLRPLTRLLVASDGGPAAVRALGWAAGLAGMIDAELVAARVIAPATAPPAAGDATRRPRLVDDVSATLQAELDGLGEALPARHRTAVLVGEAPAMLLALAESEAAGIVVLGVDEGRRPAWLRAGPVVSLLSRSAPCPVVLVGSGSTPPITSDPSRRTPNMDTETQRPRGVRFAAGTVVSPGEYRNCDTGSVRYFDGRTPLPGGVNSASWQQVSDHHHPAAEPGPARGTTPESTSHPVRFAAGSVVSPGEYRNCDTGAVRYFDGSTPLPGGVNSASWQQVSDHHHPSTAALQPEPRHTMPDTASRPVRFPAGTMVSPGEYRNCETGVVRYFDGTTPLPGGTNASSWQQVSDHHHPEPPARA